MTRNYTKDALSPRYHIAEGVVVDTSEIEIKQEATSKRVHLQQQFSIDLYETGHIFGELSLYDGLVLSNPLRVGDKIRVVFIIDTTENALIYRVNGIKNLENNEYSKQNNTGI